MPRKTKDGQLTLTQILIRLTELRCTLDVKWEKDGYQLVIASHPSDTVQFTIQQMITHHEMELWPNSDIVMDHLRDMVRRVEHERADRPYGFFKAPRNNPEK